MKLTVDLKTNGCAGHGRAFRAERAFSLVEMLVVLAILATIAGLVTSGVLRTLDGQAEKQCLANMVQIESAKDEYSRDHVGTAGMNDEEFRRYFRFGVPRCPRNANADYVNWNNLHASVTCPIHPQNAVRLNQP